MNNGKRKVLEHDEVARLLRELRDRKSAVRDYFATRLMLNTGLRVSELLSLDVGDVQGLKTVTVRGKGDKVRTVPLAKTMQRHAEDFLRWKKRRGESVSLDSPLIVSRKHGRLSPRAFQRLLDKWAVLTGIRGKVTPHTLRRSYATEIFRNRGNLRVCQELLGHSFVSTTQLYVDVNEGEKVTAVESLSF